MSPGFGMPYLEVYNKPDGGFDLILKPLAPPKKDDDSTPSDPFGGTPIEDLLEVKCPLYNKEQKKCLIYENRPLKSCRDVSPKSLLFSGSLPSW